MSALNDDAILWHKRLGHASLSLLNKLVSKDLVVGLPTIKYNDGKVCDACAKGKQVKISFKSKRCVSTSRPLEMLHIGVSKKNRNRKTEPENRKTEPKNRLTE